MAKYLNLSNIKEIFIPYYALWFGTLVPIFSTGPLCVDISPKDWLILSLIGMGLVMIPVLILFKILFHFFSPKRLNLCTPDLVFMFFLLGAGVFAVILPFDFSVFGEWEPIIGLIFYSTFIILLHNFLGKYFSLIPREIIRFVGLCFLLFSALFIFLVIIFDYRLC
jgi:hypothetical protein